MKGVENQYIARNMVGSQVVTMSVGKTPSKGLLSS